MRAKEFIESADRGITLADAIEDFMPIAISFLKLPSVPKVQFSKDIISKHDQPTFGCYHHSEESKVIDLDIEERNPNDIIRTLAHELVHYKQDLQGRLGKNSWKTGSPTENEAHEKAGEMMRMFNKKYPQYLKMQAVEFDEAVSQRDSLPMADYSKYPTTVIMKAIADLNQNREKNPELIKLLTKELFKRRQQQGVAEGLDAEAYKEKLLATLPKMMRFYEKNVQGWKPSKDEMLAAIETGYTVMKHTGDVKQAGKAMMDELNTLHQMSQGQQGVAEGSLEEIDLGIQRNENFADGKVKGKSRPGRVKRSGASCNGSVTDLRKRAKNASGEKAKMYHWCANMKSGKK